MIVKFPHHPMSVSALLGEIRPGKIRVKMIKKNVDKCRLPWSVAPKSQSITRFDCYAAVHLPYDIKICLWIQEPTGEVWISLEHNIVDITVKSSKWRNCLRVCDCI